VVRLVLHIFGHILEFHAFFRTTDGSESSTPYLIIILATNPRRNTFSTQLQELYRDISLLESNVLADSGGPQDESCIVIKGCPSTGSEAAEKAQRKKTIEDHRT